MQRLILASASPRRVELLKRLCVEFEVIPANVDEDIDGLTPWNTVMTLAERKASKLARENRDCYIIGADTLVFLDDMLLGKPHDEGAAVDMLKKLSGRRHSVYTGVCIFSPDGRKIVANEKTDVVFDELSEKDIFDYVKSGEPFDKAGAYAIQGLASVFVKKIDGNFENVIGFPLCTIRNMLKELNFVF